MKRIKIPAVPSIRRLPSYLHIVKQAQADGNQYISGTVIAEELHLEPIQVRKDLAITGIIGKPKKGYPVDELVHARCAPQSSNAHAFSSFIASCP